VSLAAALLLIAGCGGRSGDSGDDAPAEGCGAPASLARFPVSFDEGELPGLWPGSAEAPSLEALTLTTAEARRGGRALQVRVEAGAQVNGGTRAELSFDAGDRAGAPVGYAWSLYFPVGWPAAPRVRHSSGAPLWQVVGQLHDQPDCRLGETWDDYAGLGNSPPVSLQAFVLSPEDPDVQAVIADGRAAGVVGWGPEVLGRLTLGLVMGVPPELVALAPIDEGHWHDVALEVRGSTADDGRVVWWLDGQQVAAIDGRTMINDASHYFKVGLYRSPHLAAEQQHFVDEVLITRDPATLAAHREALRALPR